jgi:hypothetical protein
MTDRADDMTRRRDHAATEWIRSLWGGATLRTGFEAGWAAAMAEPLEPEACRVPEKRGLHVGYPRGVRPTDAEMPLGPSEHSKRCGCAVDTHAREWTNWKLVQAEAALAEPPQWREAIRLASRLHGLNQGSHAWAARIDEWHALPVVAAALRESRGAPMDGKGLAGDCEMSEQAPTPYALAEIAAAIEAADCEWDERPIPAGTYWTHLAAAALRACNALALTAQAHPECHPAALCDGPEQAREIERATWEAVGEELNQVFHGGTRVTNCVVHINLPFSDRPRTCDLCATDIANHPAYAIRVNAWLNARLDALRARAALEKSDE